MNGEALDLFSLLGILFSAITNSALFTVVKWFLMIYTIVLLIDVILLIFLRGVTTGLKVQLYGTERPLVSKSTVAKRWGKIASRLESDNPSQWKAAVLEADHLADELLAGSGYAGKNMGERLSSIQPGQLESFERLKEAHTTRNRIVNEADFTVTQDEARHLLEAYKRFFVELELF